jgi:glycosyltransferase involved in cell wall biosynthesis
VPPGDAPALAAAIVRLLDDAELRARFGEAASAAADGYSATALAPRYAGFFERVAAEAA